MNEFILDKYFVTNELRMFLEIQKKEAKFKNFNLNFSEIYSEDLDSEGNNFLLNFELILNSIKNPIANYAVVIQYEDNELYLKFGRKKIRNKRFALKFKSFENLILFLTKIFDDLLKHLKILDAFFIYFKDQPEFYNFYLEYYDEKMKILIKNEGIGPVKRKKIKGKKYIAIIELHFFQDINEFVIEQKIIGPKGYKLNHYSNYYILDENNAIKEFAKKWKNALFIVKEHLEKLELKFKTQKYLIKKL